ncbi:effector-associated constant component EACC1 [Nocardia sp. NPDC003963]
MSESDGRLMIRTSGGPDELLGLLDWFRHDDELRGRVSPPPPRLRDGRMGDLYDVLVVAVGAGGLAPALTRSLSAWLTHRRADITITVKRSNGAEITLDADRVKSAEVLAEVRNLLDEIDTP